LIIHPFRKAKTMTNTNKILGAVLTVAILLLATINAAGKHQDATPKNNDKVLYNFANSEELNEWLIVNDGVMGGLSLSWLSHSKNQSALYQGRVSLENNGGFASTRTRPKDYQLAGYTGIVLRIKGDGKTYQFRIRTNNRFDGASYRHEFATEKDKWITVKIPFSDFVPVFRGRVLRNVGPIDASNIQQLGILIAGKQTGPFAIEIDWIKAY
jgi:NADH dehydrogenase [ubiquinone] 1 alpha subcomplex assembly factor 1